MPGTQTVRSETVKDELLRSDAAYRSLYEEHQETKRRLASIKAQGLLSEADEIEIKRMKLHKLTLKDRMEAMFRERLHDAAATAT